MRVVRRYRLTATWTAAFSTLVLVFEAKGMIGR